MADFIWVYSLGKRMACVLQDYFKYIRGMIEILLVEIMIRFAPLISYLEWELIVLCVIILSRL